MEDDELDAILESALDDLGEDELNPSTKTTPSTPSTPQKPTSNAKTDNSVNTTPSNRDTLSTPNASKEERPAGQSPSSPHSPGQDIAADFASFLKQMEQGGESSDETKQLQMLFENLMKMGSGENPPSQTSTSSTSSSNSPGGDMPDLQQHFQRALENLQSKAESLDKLDPSQLDMEGEKILEDLAQQFEADPQLNGLMGTMMEALMSKDVMYEPMKEMRDRFPSWLEKNESTVSSEDLQRYRKQIEYVHQICIAYEQVADANVSQQKVLALMTQMMEYGQPPPDLLQEISGSSQEPMPPLPQSCSVM